MALQKHGVGCGCGCCVAHVADTFNRPDAAIFADWMISSLDGGSGAAWVGEDAGGTDRWVTTSGANARLFRSGTTDGWLGLVARVRMKAYAVGDKLRSGLQFLDLSVTPNITWYLWCEVEFLADDCAT
ncbi:MAG: hypothetical protein M3Q42_11760, partial [Pseudomonadota bacterium]|nr:hypothetical protein [Pseudomonadota bacterium]